VSNLSINEQLSASSREAVVDIGALVVVKHDAMTDGQVGDSVDDFTF